MHIIHQVEANYKRNDGNSRCEHGLRYCSVTSTPTRPSRDKLWLGLKQGRQLISCP